jgi:hypothetical protein
MEKECLEVSSPSNIWFKLRDSTLQRPWGKIIRVMIYHTETLYGVVGESTKLWAAFSMSQFPCDRSKWSDADARYFNPAEEVLPEQMITGVGCSAGTSWRERPRAEEVVLDQLFHTLMDEGEAVLIAAP